MFCLHSPVVKRSVAHGDVDIEALAADLEAMSEADRVKAVRALTKKDMARVWEACVVRKVTRDDYLPPDLPPGIEIIHEGKNSLPAFSQFQKRFCAAEGREGVVYGYNHNWHNFTTTGPGYFTGRHHPERDEYGLNYYDTPPDGARLPDGWPAIKPADVGLQRLIYANMIDYMRRICDGVTIGRAWKNGKQTDNYFVLCRTS